MEYPDRALYEYLRGLERRAAANRRRRGLPYSRRESTKALSSEFQVDLDGHRLSNWLPGDPARLQAPASSSERGSG
ncbi:hypothetical protein N4G69_54635, partial [Streptomyces mirabilis]|uniref:hypothetical protein n=1 Tax=Streptomyces mirabilis TaxID=68239 RepID=UPI0021C04296